MAPVAPRGPREAVENGAPDRPSLRLRENTKPITLGNAMSSSSSRVTAQHQISIPDKVRRRLGIVPGTELVWEERDGEYVVRPKRHSLEDVRAVCARRPVKARSLRAMRAARDRALKAKHGRGRH